MQRQEEVTDVRLDLEGEARTDNTTLDIYVGEVCHGDYWLLTNALSWVGISLV